uniref:Aminotransferase-like plant mobile domain-containing protein n=1 Tax=Fagus sylvatica TaxID=28930 RepID=A0A2N9FVM5_FAGSY
MAKSSSNNDPCSCAIQIIEALPTSQRITGILIPRENTQTSSSSTSTSPRCGLGPSFSSFPEDLSPIFPYHSYFASIYQNRQMKWGEWDTFTTSVTWYKPTPSWSAWVAIMALSKLDKWKTLRINEAIRASKYKIPINPNLLTSLLCFWSPSTNTFSFPEGFITPTVADIFALLGLRPMGALAHPLMTVGTGPNKDVDVLNGVSLSYNEFIKQMKGSGASPVTYKEECYFYFIEPKQSHGGPVWLIQMWACSYFPLIAPELHPTIEPWSYEEAWMHTKYLTEVPSFPTCFKLFSDSSRRRSPEEFMPFEARRNGSEDFHQFSSQGFFKGDIAWGACLQSRDLVAIRSANAGVEAYCPSLVGCCPAFLLYQLASPGMEHIASYVTPQPLQQISPSGKKVSGDPSSQKFSTAEISSDPLINLVDIVADRDIAFKKTKESLQLQAHLLRLPAPLEQGTFTSTKCKIPEVEEVDLAVSPKGAKPSGKKLVKIVAKKSTAKKAKVVEVVLDSSIIEVESLEEELDDTATLSNLAKAKAKDAKRKRLEVEMEKKRQVDKAEEERIVEIKKRKKKKQEEEQKREEKRKEAEAVRRKAEHVVLREAKLTKQTAVATVVSVQQVAQPAVEVRTSIEAATSSIEATTSFAQNMPEGLGDIDKLLEDVSLTLQQCQTPTKTSSTPIPLEPSKDQLQAAIDQLKELLQQPVGLVLLDANLVDQFQQVASELKSINQKVKSLEAELQLWKSKRTQKCLKLQTVHAESQGLVRGVESISRAEQDIQTLQSEINDLRMLPLMS